MRTKQSYKLIFLCLVALNIVVPLEADSHDQLKDSKNKRRNSSSKNFLKFNQNHHKHKYQKIIFEHTKLVKGNSSQINWANTNFSNNTSTLKWQSELNNNFNKGTELKFLDGQIKSNNSSNQTYIDIKNQLEIESLTQSESQQFLYADGNVVVRYNGGILKADKLTYDKKNQVAEASGNIQIYLNKQLFEAKSFKYDLINKKGSLIQVKGVFNSKDVISDLNFDFKPSKYDSLEIIKRIKKDKVLYTPDSISNWNFSTDELIIDNSKWMMKRAILSNDLLESKQIKLELNELKVYASEEKLIFKSGLNYLLIEETFSIPFFFGERTISKKNDDLQYKSRWSIGFDNLDKDGYFLGRKLKPTNLSNDFIFNIEPQFLFHRSFKGYTKSYIKKGSSATSSRVKKDTTFLDYFAVNSSIEGNIKDWDLSIEKELSSFSIDNLSNALRLKAELNKKINFLNTSFDNSFYGVYRDRVWNGSIGESEIYGGYGWKLDKEKNWQVGDIDKKNYLGFGVGLFKAERLKEKNLNTSYKVELFYEYEQKNPFAVNSLQSQLIDSSFTYIPKPIRNGIFLNTKFSSLISLYEDGNHQEYIGFGFGPEFILGDYKRKLFDYTRVAILPFYKLKNGESVFKFDQISEKLTLDLSFDQQIFGPIMFKTYGRLNLDSDSDDYEEFIDSRISLNWKKRSYEFGLFFQPHNEAGGINFALFGFE